MEEGAGAESSGVAWGGGVGCDGEGTWVVGRGGGWNYWAYVRKPTMARHLKRNRPIPTPALLAAWLPAYAITHASSASAAPTPTTATSARAFPHASRSTPVAVSVGVAPPRAAASHNAAARRK